MISTPFADSESYDRKERTQIRSPVGVPARRGFGCFASMSIVYDILYLLFLATIGWMLLLYRRITRGPSGSSLREWLGLVPLRPVAGKCVWIHGVSLGEINATRSLVAELKRRSPDTVVVISATTRTGLEQARKLYAGRVVFRFPLDLSFAIRTALSRLRPTLIVLMELETWPNLIEVTAKAGIPVVIANGRVTEERSMKRFRMPVIASVARRMFRKLTYVSAQDSTYAGRFAELGVPPQRIEVTGSVKYDTAEVVDQIDGQAELARETGIDAARPLLVAGSTGPGEEAILLDAYASLLAEFPDLQLAIVPRKPERFDEVAELIVGCGFVCLRRSTGRPQLPSSGDKTRHVVLGDTMGELRKFYALSSVVFVGRTLVPMGGSDVMEVAALAKPIIVGPHNDNFAEAVDLLLAARGCRRIANGKELAPAVAEMLRDAELRAASGAAARDAVVSRQGATSRIVDRLLELMQ